MFKEPVMVSDMHAFGPPAKAPTMNVNKSQEVYQTSILLSFVHIKSPLVNVKQELDNFQVKAIYTLTQRPFRGRRSCSSCLMFRSGML